MLVLTRKKDETIVLDGRITVKVLQVKGSTIRLGIDAPREIPVRRGELQPIAAPTAARGTGGRTDFDDARSSSYQLFLVINDHHGVASFVELVNRPDQVANVMRMQSNRRFVQNIKHVDKRRTQTRR